MQAASKQLLRVMAPNLMRRNKEKTMPSQKDMDNHGDQLNPNNDAYWQSRGEDERPDDWEDRLTEDNPISVP